MCVWERFSMSREYNFEIWCLLHFQICNKHHAFRSVSTKGRSIYQSISSYQIPINIQIKSVHIKSKHEGFKYFCDHCDFEATFNI